MERKFLINGQDTFTDILLALAKPISSGQSDEPVVGYKVRESSSKEREYRYFDTFDRILEKEDLLAYVGPLETEGVSASVRVRKEDYVLTVKIPTDDEELRKEYQNVISAEGIDFYALSLDDFLHWAPMRKVKEIGGNRSLQEVVRLFVKTNRFNLFHDHELRVEVAVDDVQGESPLGIARKLYELEIEIRGKGTEEDKETVARFFTDTYKENLVRNHLPKWIKILHLMRGLEIAPG